MPDQSIRALCAGTATALCEAHAGHLLSLDMPRAADDGGLAVEPGQRFAIRNGVAVVPVQGILTANNFTLERWLGWATYHGIAETMDHLAASDEVAAIVMAIDSPGGLVVGIDAASGAIARAAAAKPVHALVDPMAASAAYWLASQATDITMTPGAIVGSIGVMLTTAAPVQPNMAGDQWFDMRSSHARGKNPDPSTDAGQRLLQASLDQMEASFHAAVAAGRGIPIDDLPARLSVTDDPVDGGATYRFADAAARGLADAELTSANFYDDVFGRYAPAPRRSASRALIAKARAAQARATAT